MYNLHVTLSNPGNASCNCFCVICCSLTFFFDVQKRNALAATLSVTHVAVGIQKGFEFFHQQKARSQVPAVLEISIDGKNVHGNAMIEVLVTWVRHHSKAGFYDHHNLMIFDDV